MTDAPAIFVLLH